MNEHTPTPTTSTNPSSPRPGRLATAALVALAVGAGAIGSMAMRFGPEPVADVRDAAVTRSDDRQIEFGDGGAAEMEGEDGTAGLDRTVDGAPAEQLDEGEGEVDGSTYESESDATSYESGAGDSGYGSGYGYSEDESDAVESSPEGPVDEGEDETDGPRTRPAHPTADDDPTADDTGSEEATQPDPGDDEAPQPVDRGEPTTTYPRPAAAPTNATPVLPVRTIEMQIPVGQQVQLFGDTSLAAGWFDPDNTADWLCLTFTPDRRDWWLDGADCQGNGLWARVPVAGVYVVHIRVREATAEFPGGVGPQSAEGITLRLVAR